jgi:hypothetical protein
MAGHFGVGGQPSQPGAFAITDNPLDLPPGNFNNDTVSEADLPMSSRQDRSVVL